MDFGEKLQALRKENGLSQEQLAEKLNVTRQAVSKWESGALPDVDNLIKISAFFNCSLDYLMSNREEIKEEHEAKTEQIMEQEKNRTMRKISWDMKWILACFFPIGVLLVLWTVANTSDVTLHIRDATSGIMYSKFLTYVADYNLFLYVYGSFLCLYLFVTIKCLYPVVRVKNKKQRLFRIILWFMYMLGIVVVHNNLLNPRSFFIWSGKNFVALILYFGVLLVLEAIVKNLKPGDETICSE